MDIPATASRVVPDLFNGVSYCVLGKLAGLGGDLPDRVTFLPISLIDATSSPRGIVFGGHCRVAKMSDVRGQIQTMGRFNVIEKPAYRAHKELRVLGEPRGDI